ncbi:MAG: hypothetical protein ACYC77_07485 [Coriobacteriia bacterium]
MEVRSIVSMGLSILLLALYAARFLQLMLQARSRVDATTRAVDYHVVHQWMTGLRHANAMLLSALAIVQFAVGVGQPGFIPGGIVGLAMMGFVAWLVEVAPLTPAQELRYARFVLGASDYTDPVVRG